MKLRTVKEACEALRVSRSTLFRMARIGTIRFTRLGPRKNLVAEDQIERLVQRSTQ